MKGEYYEITKSYLLLYVQFVGTLYKKVYTLMKLSEDDIDVNFSAIIW
jgi:hypothetical protein